MKAACTLDLDGGMAHTHFLFTIVQPPGRAMKPSIVACRDTVLNLPPSSGIADNVVAALSGRFLEGPAHGGGRASCASASDASALVTAVKRAVGEGCGIEVRRTLSRQPMSIR